MKTSDEMTLEGARLILDAAAKSRSLWSEKNEGIRRKRLAEIDELLAKGNVLLEEAALAVKAPSERPNT